MTGLTESQKNRLTELGLSAEELPGDFETIADRETFFKQTEKALVAKNRQILNRLLTETYQPALCQLQFQLAQTLCANGFTQVTTPTIISRKFLDRMTIDGTHPLNEQVFWLDPKSCLRPMLAPNLYSVSKDLMNVAKLPLRVFEIGSCFRKESEGRSHLKEFTMLNLVEWGTPMEERGKRLEELGRLVLDAAGINGYATEAENSVVYGDGLDFIGADGLELASTSMGPHPLDAAWKINCTWVGIGFGLERLLMYREHQQGIHRHSRSISFLDGARLNIK